MGGDLNTTASREGGATVSLYGGELTHSPRLHHWSWLQQPPVPQQVVSPLQQNALFQELQQKPPVAVSQHIVCGSRELPAWHVL